MLVRFSLDNIQLFMCKFQETISGMVPYHEIRYGAGMIHVLFRQQPPKRPEELSGPDERHICGICF